MKYRVIIYNKNFRTVTDASANNTKIVRDMIEMMKMWNTPNLSQMIDCPFTGLPTSITICEVEEDIDSLSLACVKQNFKELGRAFA